jgi:hypothetical protein
LKILASSQKLVLVIPRGSPRASGFLIPRVIRFGGSRTLRTFHRLSAGSDIHHNAILRGFRLPCRPRPRRISFSKYRQIPGVSQQAPLLGPQTLAVARRDEVGDPGPPLVEHRGAWWPLRMGEASLLQGKREKGPALVVRFWLSCPVWLSCSGGPGLAVLSWLSFAYCPFLVVLSL